MAVGVPVGVSPVGTTSTFQTVAEPFSVQLKSAPSIVTLEAPRFVGKVQVGPSWIQISAEPACVSLHNRAT